MHYAMHCPHAENVMQFLHRIGLEVSVKEGSSGFVNHIEVVDGGLRVDPQAPASALLHEAGHLAVVPLRFRPYLGADLAEGIDRIFVELDQMQLEPDDPLNRAMLQAGDPEATAWAWSAGKAIGIPDDLIIQSNEYGGDGAFIRDALAANCNIGINGISHAGFCVTKPNPYRPLPVYPSLAFWLQQ